MTWNSVNKSEWNLVDFVSGRVATEQDVELGRAVFFVEIDSSPYEMKIPQSGSDL